MPRSFTSSLILRNSSNDGKLCSWQNSCPCGEKNSSVSVRKFVILSSRLQAPSEDADLMIASSIFQLFRSLSFASSHQEECIHRVGVVQIDDIGIFRRAVARTSIFRFTLVICFQRIRRHQLYIRPRDTPENILQRPMIAVCERVYLSPDAASPVLAIRSAAVVWEIITRSVLAQRIAFMKST